MDTVKNELSYWSEELKKLKDSERFIWDYCDRVPYKKSIYKKVLDKEYGNKLNDICKNNSLLKYTFLVSTLNVTLSKYMSKNDIVIGIPCYSSQKNKGNVHINKLLPLISNIDYEKSYLEYMDSIKSKVLESYKNQAYLNSKILLQNNLPNDVMELTPISISMKGLHEDKDINYICESSKNEFSFLLDPMEDKSIDIQIIYNSNKITEVTVKTLFESYITVLKEVLNNYNKKIKDIEILPEKDVNKILHEFNDTEADYSKHKTIQELFEAQVEKTPENIAVVFEDKRLTYRELNERANSLARVLRKKGVKADSIVGIMVERSLEMIVGIMGILKAGGAYLPIDPNYPKKRIEYVLKDSESKILLSENSVVEAIEFDGEVIDLFNETLFSKDSSNLEKINNSDDLVYVIYTSGTTGNPKGAMIEHRSLVNRLNWMQKKYPISENDTILQKTTYTFDVSVWEILWWSLVGAKVCMLSPNNEKDPMKIIEAIDRYEITTLHFVPSMLDLFLYCVEENINNINISSLRQVFSSGEALNFKQVSKFYEKFKNGKKLINLYGPTEATIDVSYFDCSDDNKKVIPIGKPIDNTKLYVLKNNEIVPVGVTGELYIAGDGLARGYVNRPELTAEKFIDNPFETGTKMYKTGDLARWLPDGNIEFLGRIDNQVKIRGFRIELGEIENRLLQCESINEAAVLVKENKVKEKYICAYVVSKKNLEELNLRSYLKDTLPEYMVPAYFVQVEKMPLTANGKLDRRALPEPNLDTSLTEYEAPRNEIEETLAKIWSDVLGVEKIGINDNFFEHGGHSLRATMLMFKIHKQLNKEVSLKELFKYPTIKELGLYIENSEEKMYSKIEKIEEKEYYEASSAQKRMYMLQQFDKDSTAYNMPVIFELEGKVDKNKIEETFKKLTRRHEALRTYFEVFNGEIIQKLQEYHELELVCRNENENIEDIINNFVRPFDLEKDTLFRVMIVENKGKNYLLIDMHHIISDGVSMSILIKEFTELYSGKSLEPLKLQYKDFVAWQNNFLKLEDMKKQEEYWINRFSDEIPVLNMPTDYERPPIQSFEGDSIKFEVDEETTRKLRKLAKETETTMHMVLLSAFNILLSKYSGQEDVIVGMPIAGRLHADLQNIMGMFVNTLAIRNEPKGSKKYTDFLKEVKENALKAYENQSYQLETLVEKLGVRRGKSRNPLFDVMFNMADMEIDKDIKLDNIILKQFNIGSRVSKLDITLNALENSNKINFSIEYCSKLFKKETIERLSNHYVKVLDSIVNYDHIKLCEIDLLSKSERLQILNEFNDTKVDYQNNKTIHELFEAQVEKMSEHTAVVFEDKKLTYKELNERANSLARMLKNKGVKTDSIVGIMVERSLEMVVGIMGILKAGGAYLPIDPSYPKERIEYMLEDSESKVLLTKNILVENIDFHGTIIDVYNEELYKGKTHNLQNMNVSGDLAYVIYTSGTTGNPKGVMIEHGSVINTLNYMQNKYPLIKSDAYLLKTAFTFDVSVTEIFGWFIGNGKLIILKQGEEKDPKSIIDSIEKNNVTHINFAPSMLNLFVNTLNEDIEKIKSLKYIFSAGESISNKLVREFRSLLTRIKLENIYGPTETTIYATKYATENFTDEINVSIGKPIDNAKAYIIDKNNKLLPIGIPGELCISGHGLARGYLNRPELTEEKFVENPFEPERKMYKTGDLARWLSDGNIEFLGRIDNQVKIRGYRIELGEIEDRLLQNPIVKEAVVVVKENKRDEKYICAYVVSEEKINELNLRDYLKERLPEYMVPSYFVELKNIPYTHNGKIDKKALPDPKLERYLNEYKAPRNQIEEALTNIWSEVLGIKKVGIDDDFFNIGGNSIIAVRIVRWISKTFQINLLVKDLLANPDIKSLAKVVEARKSMDMVKEIESDIIKNLNVKIYFEKYYVNNDWCIVLFCDLKKEEILDYIYTKYSNEYLPHYILKVSDFEHIRNEEGLIKKIKVDNITKSLLKKVEMTINENIRLQNEELNRLLISGEKSKYLCGHAQLKIFNRGYNDIIQCIIPINNVLNSANINKALIETINKNASLRTYITYEKENYFFNENSFIEQLNINVLDFSKYNQSDINQFKQLISNELYINFVKSEKLGRVPYTFVLVKINEKSYELLMLFSHLIFDAASIKILQRAFYKNLKEVMSGNISKVDKRKLITYKDYVYELETNTTIEKIRNYKMSKEYLDIIEAIKKYKDNRVNNKKLKEYIFEYKINDNNYPSLYGSKKSEGIALWISLNIAKVIFERNEFTVRVTKNGRQLGEGNFGNLVGDCHIHVPILLKIEEKPKLDYIDQVNHEYKKFYNDQKIYIEYMAYGNYKGNIEGNEIEKMLLELDFAFNYIGELTDEENDLYCKSVNESQQRYSRQFFYAHTNKNKIYIRCRLPEDYDNGKIKQIEEIQAQLIN
ncbi:amino acid adenylation domain-containing protein [Bacillus paranthracis]|uniref:amino acid adenylation domain-containing protein n=1 Tax=Bacillus paranthracis TaxID=2026186 RepID=UPI003D1EAAEF